MLQKFLFCVRDNTLAWISNSQASLSNRVQDDVMTLIPMEDRRQANRFQLPKTNHYPARPEADTFGRFADSQ
jgi:hypothetical protein